MAKSAATTVDEYLAELTPERREIVDALRQVILANLPSGYEEIMDFGMITYCVPLEVYPKTYNGHPLEYAALGSQKNYVSVYLMDVYSNPDSAQRFNERYLATGKRLDMGKSCVRFRRLDDVPLEVIGEAIARTSVAEYTNRVSGFEAQRAARKTDAKRPAAKKAT